MKTTKKRDKHITLNIDADTLDNLQFIAEATDRKTADIARILLCDAIARNIDKYISIKNGEYIKI